MTKEELSTGKQLNDDIVDLTKKIAAINSDNYKLSYAVINNGGGVYQYITDDLTTTTALKTAILADLQASLDAKQAEFDAL